MWQLRLGNLTICASCSTHWSNIHHTLLHALPDESIIHFHHTVTDFSQPQGSDRVHVTAEVGEERKKQTFEGDLLIAADGSMSMVRSKFQPQDKRRCVVLACSCLCPVCTVSLHDATVCIPKKVRPTLNATYSEVSAGLLSDISGQVETLPF